MGTVNYKTSELITIASPAPRYFEDYRLDAEEEARETGEDADEIIDRWIELDEEDARIAAEDAADEERERVRALPAWTPEARTA